MKKRVTSFILACLMLTSAGLMGSCSEGAENGETTSSANTSTSQEESVVETNTEDLSPAEERSLIPDDLPAVTFDGRSYLIATTESKEYEILSEELTGEGTNDAVYDRNIRIEDRFDVKIEPVISSAPYEDIRTVVMSGTYAYDVAGFINYMAYTPIFAKVLYNWTEVPYVDLSKPWYNQLANDPATINNTLFTVNGDLSISTLQYTYGMFFNYNILEQYGITSSQLYDMVFDGTWTIDNMRGIITGIWEDTNGDGTHDKNDVHGYSVCTNGVHTTDVWLAALDIDVASIASDGSSFEVTFFNEKTVSALEKVLALTYDENGSYVNTGDWRETPSSFAEGKIAMTQLYFGETTESLGDMEDTYGILPLPKFDESQEGYYTNAWDQFTVFAIPKTISEADKEVTGIIFEALNAESYKTVYPAYYDQALKSRYSAEPTTAEIIDIIMAGRKLEFTFQFGTKVSELPYLFRGMVTAKDTNVASKYKKIQKALNKQIQTLIDLYCED